MDANDHQREFGAPWGRLLKGTSAAVTLLVIGISIIGVASGAGVLFVLLPMVLLPAVPFVVRGYRIEGDVLLVRRLGWETMIAMSDLQSVEAIPNIMRYSIRTCGNGGLLSFTGLFSSRKLGPFRAFVNDLNRTVVLRFSRQTIVVSPDDPEGFAGAIKDQLQLKA